MCDGSPSEHLLDGADGALVAPIVWQVLGVFLAVFLQPVVVEVVEAK